jgi:hypothetical protein
MPDDRGQIDNVFDLKKEEKKKKSSPIIVVEKEMIKSEAWLSIRGVAPHVYIIFLTKRRMEKIGKKGHQRTLCTNSQELIFTYSEAKEKYGITKREFSRAIDNLIEHGFIDIVTIGGGMFREETVYGLSERWRKWGTSEFEEKKRKIRKISMGFCKPERKT